MAIEVLEGLAYHNYKVLNKLGVIITNKTPDVEEHEMFQGAHVRRYGLEDEISQKENPSLRKKVKLVPLHHSIRTVEDASDASHNPKVKFYIKFDIIKKSTFDVMAKTDQSNWSYHLAKAKNANISIVAEPVVCDLYDVFHSLVNNQCPYKIELNNTESIPTLILTPIHVVDNNNLAKDIEQDINMSLRQKEEIIKAGLEEFVPE